MPSVQDVMTRQVRTLTAQHTLSDAARLMDELNVGVVPVCEGERLVGMLTDRDIVVRGLARDLDAATCRLGDIMSGHVRTARPDDDMDDVLAEMSKAQIRRMPVVDANERLLGIVTLGDIAAKTPQAESEVASSLGDISEPAEPDLSGPGAKG